MLNLYTETAVEVKPAPNARRINIPIPRANGSYDRSKHSKKPERHDRLANDDRSYTSEYLASASSIFYRHSHNFPRSFLWRVISHGKVLEVLNADFSRHEEKEQEANAVLAFEFQDSISPRGVSICDSPRGKGFYIFILTRENEVFELRLQTDFFQNPDSIPQDTGSWCSPIRASSLSIDKAFQIEATNPQDVFVSFASGKVQHWRRDDADQQWSHVNYDDKTWGTSLLSIVTRKAHPDVEFDGMRLAYNTAHAMTRSGQYLFTVCLNHTLRIWHLDTGKLVDSRDLLDQARQPHENLQLKPAEPGYVQFLDGASKTDQILLTHSPLDGGQVKLWRVRNTFDDPVDHFSIEDIAPDSTLSLPDPDPTGNTVWMLTGLKVIFDKHTKDWQAWILWRNNNYHKAYTLDFRITDIANQWQYNWVAVSAAKTKAVPPDFVGSDIEDIRSKWLKYIFFPGRYPPSLVETALAQFSTVMDARLPSDQKSRSIQARTNTLISSQISVRKFDDGAEDLDRLVLDTDRQWRQFWRILENLNETRFAPLSLSADPTSGMAALTMADACCVIRECSSLELLETNVEEEISLLNEMIRNRWPYRKLTFNSTETRNVQALLTASLQFYNSFSPDLLFDFQQGLEDDLFAETNPENTPQRIVDFFNQIDFANAVTDDAENDLQKALSEIGGAVSLSNKLFDVTLQYLIDHKARHGKGHQHKTDFGTRVTFTALLEEILDLRNVLYSLIAVVMFLDETNDFDPASVYDELIKRLKVQERNFWLGTNRKSSEAGTSTSTLLQDIYHSSSRLPSFDSHPLPYLVTRHVQDTLDYVSGESAFRFEDSAVYLQCWLLRHNELDLAKDFLRFQPNTSWAIYIRGRLHLAAGEQHQALEDFQAPSADMSGGKALGKLEEFSNRLLSSDEAAHFYSGRPLYLQHVLNLFESRQAYPEVAEIAQMALQSLESVKSEPAPNFRQNILSKQFTAQLKTSKYDSAFDALIQFTDPVQQSTCTTELVDTMLNSNTSSHGTASAVKHIQRFPLSSYPQLSATIDQHLTSLAKKQCAIPSAGVNISWLSNSRVDYLSVLHALRLSRGDYSGAASVLFDRLRVIQKSGRARSDPQATALRQALLALINVMTCVAEDEAYIVADAEDDPRVGGKSLKRLRHADASEDEPRKKRSRVVVTLDDLRREYQKVLDRCSRIERGDFEFNANVEESEDEGDGVWEGSRLQIDDKRSTGALVLGNGDAMQLE